MARGVASRRVTGSGSLSLDDARRLVSGYVNHYNNVRLNSATGYITPKDMLAGWQREIHAERDRKLEEARKQRQTRLQASRLMQDRALLGVGGGSSCGLPTKQEVSVKTAISRPSGPIVFRWRSAHLAESVAIMGRMLLRNVTTSVADLRASKW